MQDLVEGRTGTLPDGTRVVVRNGQVVPLTGPEAAGFEALGGGWYRGPDGGTYQEGRGGAMVRRSEATEAPNPDGGGGGSPKLTEDQGKSQTYARLMADAEVSYQQALRDGFDPTGFQAGAANFIEGIPMLSGVGNFIRDDAGDRARQAELQWTDAQLKAMSGAASPEPEVVRNQITNFARPGQNFEDIRAQLDDARLTAFEAASLRAGPGAAGVKYPDINGPAPADAVIADATRAGVGGIGGIAGAAQGGLAPGSYEPTDQLRSLDADSNGQVSVEELEAAGMRFENGQWVIGTASGGPGSPPSGPDAPSGPDGPQPIVDFSSLSRAQQDALAGGFNPIARVGAFDRAALEQLPFAKEAVAGISSLFNGRSYQENRDAQKFMADYDRRYNPNERNIGGVAGFTAGVVSPGALSAGRWVASAPNLGYAMTRGAAVGAGGGAVFGAAQTEGGLAERGQGAMQGAMVGGVTGGALPPLARVTGAMTEGLTRPIRQAAGDGIARMTGRPLSGDDRAVRTLLRGTNPDQMAERLAEGRRYGADLTLADVGGSNVQSRARVAATRQTPGREVAQDFSAGRRSEVQDFTAGLGQRVSPLAATPDQLDTALEQYQRQASASAFGAVRGDRVSLNRDSILALRSDEGRAAVKDAARLYASSTDDAERNVAAELNRLADEVLDNPAGAEVTVGAADLMARYLNRAGGADANRNRVFGALGRTIRTDARTQNPGYDQALTDYASRARLGGAVETGERFLGRGYTGDFVEAAGGMDDAQRGIARASARAGIERASETAGSAPGVLDKLATGRGQQQRSAALLGTEGAADLQQGARVGRRMVDAGNNVNPRAGSNTYLNAQDENAQAVGGIVGNLASGRPMQALGGVVDLIRSAGMSDQQAEAVVRLATDPARAEEALRILRTRFPEQEARRIMSQLTPAIATQAGAASAPQPQVRMVGPRP